MISTIFRHPAFWAWVIVLAAAAGLSVAAGRYDYFAADLALAQPLQAVKAGWFRFLMLGTSYFSGGWQFGLIVLLTGVLLWKRVGIVHVAVVLAAGVLSYGNDLMKLIIGRPRPAAELVASSYIFNGLSFPSGHTFSSSMLLGTLVIFALLSGIRWWLKALAISTVTGLLLLVGVSRVYLGAHWPSDVLGSYLWAGVLLIPLYYILRRPPLLNVFTRERRPRGPDAAETR
jgi:undecaprenyl-diphosphatase